MSGWSLRGLRRRVALLGAATLVGAAGVGALAATSAHAYTDENGADFAVNPQSLDQVFSHGLSFTCDPVETQPATGTATSTVEYINPCAMTVKLTVSKYVAKTLKLSSTTLMSGPVQSKPTKTVTRSGGSTETVDGYTYTAALSPAMVRTLKAKAIKGFRLDGLAVTLSGTARYAGFAESAGPPATQTDTSRFSMDDLLGVGPINSCWIPANRGFQIGLADPHGHLCPGY